MDNGVVIRIRGLYALVSMIVAMLIGSIYLLYENSKIISENKAVQEDAERAKVNTLDVLRNLHLLDLGVRGYALLRKPELKSSVDSAHQSKDPIFNRLKQSLEAHDFPSMDLFAQLKDSVDLYFRHTEQMMTSIEKGDREKFLRMLDADRGYYVWLQYKAFAREVNYFEDDVKEQAKRKYESAIKSSYYLQILVTLLASPLLVYLLFYVKRAFQLSDQLRKAETERNKMLVNRNEELDRLVKEKTMDIAAQNEEIMTQNEEIRTHNDHLITQQVAIERANQIIAEQSTLLMKKNDELRREVLEQTQHLRASNQELVDQNSRLEQFAYIISHNLRAPLARVQGLASLLGRSKESQEKDNLTQMLVSSSQDLEKVIADLSQILNIQKSFTQINSDVLLRPLLLKVVESLEGEIRQVGGSIEVQVLEGTRLETFAPYLESVFYNLLNNAIKYRNPERQLTISIKAEPSHKALCIRVSDNGLGIDLSRFGSQIFSLYKRFHLHVEGKGMGLFLVKTQVEALGGRIEVQSTVGMGTTFSIYFS